jgi:thiol-disulfide isomerase/thioredoxin
MLALVLAALVHHTPQPSIREGAVPPSFSQLREIHGKPVVINFWATWCKPCTDELKYFTQAESEYGSRIAIITISTEPHDVAASYFRLWNIDLPVIEDLDSSISKLYATPPIPLTVVVDPDGTIGHISFGELDKGELDTAIQQALALPAGSPSPGVLR